MFFWEFVQKFFWMFPVLKIEKIHLELIKNGGKAEKKILTFFFLEIHKIIFFSIVFSFQNWENSLETYKR